MTYNQRILQLLIKKDTTRAEMAHVSLLKGAQVWDFDVLDFNDFFIMKSI